MPYVGHSTVDSIGLFHDPRMIIYLPRFTRVVPYHVQADSRSDHPEKGAKTTPKIKMMAMGKGMEYCDTVTDICRNVT
jgi:hypothetical protein